MDIVKSALEKKPEKVHKHWISNGSVITVEMKPIEGFSVNLYIAETKNGNVGIARYEAWNEKKNVAFIVNLLGRDPLEL